MKQKYGIVLLLFTIGSACLAIPTTSQFNSKAKAIAAEINETDIAPRQVSNISSKSDEAESNTKAFSDINSLGNVNDLKPTESNTNNSVDQIHQQHEELKDFEKDFLLLEERIPDLTDEEYSEINREGSTPWNFLKYLDLQGNLKAMESSTRQYLPIIYITVPVLINGHSNVPLSLAIGKQNITLQFSNSETTANVTNVPKTTSITYNNLKDHDGIPMRQTNRHRSNFRKKIYALNNN